MTVLPHLFPWTWNKVGKCSRFWVAIRCQTYGKKQLTAYHINSPKAVWNISNMSLPESDLFELTIKFYHLSCLQYHRMHKIAINMRWEWICDNSAASWFSRVNPLLTEFLWWICFNSNTGIAFYRVCNISDDFYILLLSDILVFLCAKTKFWHGCLVKK